jgi:hypothetical protein
MPTIRTLIAPLRDDDIMMMMMIIIIIIIISQWDFKS